MVSTNMLSRQPTELDYADSTKFRFKINKLPKVEFFTTQCTLPGINLGDVVIPSPFKEIPIQGHTLTYDNLDITPYDKCFIKLYISNKTDTDMYERLMDRLYNHINLHAIDVIEDPTDIGASVREDILEQGEDTLTFLGNYIDQIDVKIDKQKLKAFAKELYMEAGE